MRKIKFKFWNEEKRFMSDWETSKKHCDRLSLLDLKPWVPLQYTGLKDRNGKEIYENDLVSFKCQTCEEIHLGDIIFLEDLACFGIRAQGENGYQESPLQIPLANDRDIIDGVGLIDIQELLGNSYQNPELIKEE